MYKITMVTPIAAAGILTLAILAMISLTNHVFAQEKPTQLTIKVSPEFVGESPYQVTGRLTSEGKGLGGATISFNWSMGNRGAEILSPTQTNSDGFYGLAGSIPYPIDNVIAHYAGDSGHTPAQSEAFLKYRTPANHP
jgi:hypothetical protein